MVLEQADVSHTMQGHGPKEWGGGGLEVPPIPQVILLFSL